MQGTLPAVTSARSLSDAAIRWELKRAPLKPKLAPAWLGPQFTEGASRRQEAPREVCFESVPVLPAQGHPRLEWPIRRAPRVAVVCDVKDDWLDFHKLFGILDTHLHAVIEYRRAGDEVVAHHPGLPRCEDAVAFNQSTQHRIRCGAPEGMVALAREPN